MRYYIQPLVKETRHQQTVSWHTFRRRHTTLLHANVEDVKVVQELLRHSSSRITMDIYAQAQMPAKRGTAESGGDGAVGETRTGGQNDGLAAPQSAPRRK